MAARLRYDRVRASDGVSEPAMSATMLAWSATFSAFT
jgi:hypothetical protein